MPQTQSCRRAKARPSEADITDVTPGPALALVLVTALFCPYMPLSSPAAAQTAGSSDAAGAAALFDDGQVHEIWLQINARDWEQLRADYLSNTYYPADLEWEGRKVYNAGVRVRGRTSRTPHKPALRIDFNRYVAGQEFLGLRSLNLDNLWQDPSMMRERVSMLVFDRLGLPAPREAHVRLYVGARREFAGLYTFVEAIDRDFLNRVFGESGGHLYEYQWHDEYRFDKAPNDLDWYAARFEPRTHESASAFEHYDPLRELVRLIAETPGPALEEALAPYFDLRRYITHVAVENVLSNPDGLVGGLGMNNFYLYRYQGTTRATLVPWDQDLAFEQIDAPTPDAPLASNVLTRKIWETETLRQQYLQALLEVADVIGPPDPLVSEPCAAAGDPEPCGWLEAEIDRQYRLIHSSAQADHTSPHAAEQFEAAVADLRRFARERSTLVRAYVGRVSPALLTGRRVARQ